MLLQKKQQQKTDFFFSTGTPCFPKEWTCLLLMICALASLPYNFFFSLRKTAITSLFVPEWVIILAPKGQAVSHERVKTRIEGIMSGQERHPVHLERRHHLRTLGVSSKKNKEGELERRFRGFSFKVMTLFLLKKISGVQRSTFSHLFFTLE